MPIKVFTIAFDAERERFLDDELVRFLRGRKAGVRKEEFFSRNGKDYWTIVVEYEEDDSAGREAGGRDAADGWAQFRDAFNITPREAVVASEMTSGRTNREIGSRLGISERTVKAHLAKVYAKLGVENKVELVNKLKEFNLF